MRATTILGLVLLAIFACVTVATADPVFDHWEIPGTTCVLVQVVSGNATLMDVSTYLSGEGHDLITYVGESVFSFSNEVGIVVGQQDGSTKANLSCEKVSIDLPSSMWQQAYFTVHTNATLRFGQLTDADSQQTQYGCFIHAVGNGDPWRYFYGHDWYNERPTEELGGDIYFYETIVQADDEVGLMQYLTVHAVNSILSGVSFYTGCVPQLYVTQWCHAPFFPNLPGGSIFEEVLFSDGALLQTYFSGTPVFSGCIWKEASPWIAVVDHSMIIRDPVIWDADHIRVDSQTGNINDVLMIQYTVDVKVLDNESSPIEDAWVNLSSVSQSMAYSGQTDSQGKITFYVNASRFYKSSPGSWCSRTNLTPYWVNITAGNRSLSFQDAIDKKTNWTVQLLDAGTVVNNTVYVNSTIPTGGGLNRQPAYLTLGLSSGTLLGAVGLLFTRRRKNIN